MECETSLLAIEFSIRIFDHYNLNKKSFNPITRKFYNSNYTSGYNIVKILYSCPYYSTNTCIGAIYHNEEKNYHIITFRGTQETFEWMNNLNVKQEILKFENSNNLNESFIAHKGYIDLYKQIDNDIQEYIKEKTNEDSTIIICGHSLGGALSILTSIYILNNTKNRKINLIVFGAPKIVSSNVKDFIEKHSNIVISYHRETDPVPKSILFNKYHHVGEIIQLSSYGHYWWQYPLCHEMNFYYKGICDLFKIDDYKILCRFEIPKYLRFINKIVTINP